MKLADGIHLIASGNLGVNLTHPLDCNAYAIECGEECWLIDAGVGAAPHLISAQLEESGMDPARVTRLLLTHYHLDHSGGAHWLRRHYKLAVCASVATAKALETADEEAISLAQAKRAGIYPMDFPFHACPVAQVLAAGERLRSGDATVEAIATPGHSADMITYRVTQPGRVLLFPGDTFFHSGRIVLQDTWDCDLRAYSSSLRLLAATSFDMLFPGHGLWSLAAGHRHIEEAARHLDRLSPPPNL